VKRLIAVAGAVAVLGTLVYLTKPGGTTSPRTAGSSTAIPADGDDAGPAERIVYRSPSKDAGPDGGAGPADPEERPRRRVLHGGADVVRGRDAEEEPYRPVARPRFPPDWKNPIELTFRELKGLRREFRRNRGFDDETVRRLSGAAVVVSGAVMPIDPVPRNSRMERFWVANPVIVMAGCVFCVPPTMGDLVYVDAGKRPYRVDREQLYRSVVRVEARGRLILGPGRGEDGVEYMFGLELAGIRNR